MPVFSTAGVRFIVAGILLIAYSALRGGGTKDRVNARHWKAAFIVGGALLLGGNGAVVFAEKTVTSGIAALMIAATPMWFAILSRVFLKERIHGLVIFGLVIGFLGLALLALPGAGANHIDPVGFIALLFAPIAWTSGSLYSKHATFPQRPLMAAGLQMFAGGILLFTAGIVTGELSGFHMNRIDAESWWALIYLIAIGSLVGYTSYIWLLKHARTSLISTYAYVNPVVAVVLGSILLDERLSGRTGVAAAVIILGVALIVSARPDVA